MGAVDGTGPASGHRSPSAGVRPASSFPEDVMSTPPALQCGAEPEPHHNILALLRALDIQEIIYSLSGGGDDGEITLEAVVHQTGAVSSELPPVPIGLDGYGAICTLPPTLERIASDLPEGDWVNNEGGAGTVTIRPFERDPQRRFDCDMIYGDEEYEADEDFEDIEFELDSVPVDDLVPAIRLIDDTGDGR